MSVPTAAKRARVSRFPSPASTRMRVRSVSSNVRLPALPDARIETRKPMGIAPCQQPQGWKTRPVLQQQTFKIMAERADSVNEQQTRNLSIVEKTQQARRSRVSANPLIGPRTVTAICSGLKNSRASVCSSSRVTASIDARISSSEEKRWKYSSWRARLDIRDLVDSSESISEPFR